MYNFKNRLILITSATNGMGLVATENIISFVGVRLLLLVDMI